MLNITEADIINRWKSKGVLVSISCTTYNHVDYISDTLDGFIMQKTVYPFEILVHDDCSTDGTDEVIKEYEKKFPNIIKPIYEAENQYQQGKPANSLVWNVPRAKGKYIAFCEGDDYWIDENKLQIEVDFLEKNQDYGLIYTNFNIYYQDSKEFLNNCFSLNQSNFTPIYTDVRFWVVNLGYQAPMTWVYRKDLIEDGLRKYKALFETSPDTTYTLFTYFLCFSKVKYIDTVTSVYRVLSKSVTHSNSIEKKLSRNKQLFESQLKMIDEFNIDSEVKKLVTEKYYSMSFIYFILLNKQDELAICKQLNLKITILKKTMLVLSRCTTIRNILNCLYKQYKKHERY